MLVQICSTTLQSCTSSNAQIGIWSCYQHKKHANTLLQNARLIGKKIFAVLLPYEFTLLQNLKRGRKLLPVHISQGFSITFYHITFLLSEGHIDYYTCANLFNYPAILYLSKCSNRHLKLLPAQKSHKYTTPKPFTIWYSRNLLFYYPMNLHYSKTNVDNTVYHMRFYYRMNLHYSKTSKEDWSCYQCMYHKAFQMHFIISLPFCPKNILSAMLVQICSTTLRSCTSSNAQIGIWSCYRRKSLANTLLQNCEMVIEG